jgi:hypothetical protein
MPDIVVINVGKITFEELKTWLREEDSKTKLIKEVIPIFHNKELIILQFLGWSINLYSDGTYKLEVTEGG